MNKSHSNNNKKDSLSSKQKLGCLVDDMYHEKYFKFVLGFQLICFHVLENLGVLVYFIYRGLVLISPV